MTRGGESPKAVSSAGTFGELFVKLPSSDRPKSGYDLVAVGPKICNKNLCIIMQMGV